MLKSYASTFIQIGRELSELSVVLTVSESYGDDPGRDLSEDELAQALMIFGRLIGICQEVDMPVSLRVLDGIALKIPKTNRELEIIETVLRAEIASKMFLFVPQHRAKYYEFKLNEKIVESFPAASVELTSAGNSLAVGLYTAAVFHAMRAAEIGVRALGQELGVAFPDKPIELADWHVILDQTESKIGDKKNLPRGTFKDEELHFYSDAAKQFRYFKDKWRVRCAHAREVYDETPATRAVDHTIEFFETLATRLREPA